jgi:hypothetical protein
MANGRNKGIKGDTGRDSGGFVALPWAVLDCIAYARLSHPARALLMEVAPGFYQRLPHLPINLFTSLIH